MTSDRIAFLNYYHIITLVQFSAEIYKVVEEAVYSSSKYVSSECAYTKFQVWL